MILRQYQQDAVNAIENQWSTGFSRTLLSAATGTGKTIIFSQIIKDQVQNGSKALILAHREELLSQAADKLKQTVNLDSALEKAEHSAYGAKEPVVIGSIQSMCKDNRLALYSPDYFKTIIVDEAHHVMSDTYQKVLRHFRSANVLGATATPDRGDMKNLAQYFQSQAYEYTLPQGIHDGYLSPIKAMMIPLKLDIRNTKISNGDFQIGELSNKLEPYLIQIAEEMMTYCKNRKTMVFLPLVKTSQKFTQILNSKGFRAIEVNCNTPNREEILNDFSRGKYNVICNAMLLTEGYDEPSIDCIVILRPTKIRSLYQQMVGRGTRIAPNKKDLLLLDFLWLSERLDLCRPSSLIAKNENIAKRINDMIAKDSGEVDILNAEKQAERDAIQEREDALRKELERQRRKANKLVDPIQIAFSINDEALINYEPTYFWEKEPATDKQIAVLEKMGIATDTIQNKGYASLLFEKLKMRQSMGYASPKQIRELEKRGFRNVGTWTFNEASKVISTIASNDWRLPQWLNPLTYKQKEVI